MYGKTTVTDTGKLHGYRQLLDLHLSDYNHACRTVAAEKQALKEAGEHAENAGQAVQIVQAVAEEIQTQAHQAVASVVTKCLQSVFGEDSYVFKIDFRKARNKTEARLLLAKDGEEFDPMDAAGGGIVDVAAFALRVAALVLGQPKRRLFLALDEPFRFVNGQEYQDRVAGMLEAVSRDLGVQFLIITDDPWLKIGKVIELE